MFNKMRVAVVFGGKSSEHDVSLLSAQAVLDNIDKEKYDIIMIGITRNGQWLRYCGSSQNIPSGEWESIAKVSCDSQNIIDKLSSNEEKIDVIFPVLHGNNGEDGTIQGLFEMLGIPYVGCGVLSSAICMDKAVSKVIFEKEGIPVPKYLVFDRHQINDQFESIIRKVQTHFSYPLFVKPVNTGSSIGVSKVYNAEELKTAMHVSAQYDKKVIIEEFINAREIECAILGNREVEISLLAERTTSKDFLDYEAKYIKDGYITTIPANLPEETTRKIMQYAEKAYLASDCSGMARVDFFVHKVTGEIYINEINTIPGLTNFSVYPILMQKSGIGFTKLLDKLFSLAIEQYQNNKRNI